MMGALRALLPKGRLARGVAVLAGGSAFGQLLALAASPLLTRLYTPADFGLLAVFSAIVEILGVVACLRYDLAIPLVRDERRVVDLLALSLVIALLVSSLAATLLWLWGEVIVGWLNAEGLQPLLWLLPFGVLGAGWLRAFLHWGIRRQEFGRITRTEVSRSIGRVVTQIGLGLAGSGPFGLLLGHVVGLSAGITTLARAFHRKEAGWSGDVRLRGMLQAAGRYAKLAALASGTALLKNSGQLVPALLVAALYGVDVAGWFALAQRILAAPVSLGAAVAQVYLGEAPRRLRANDASLHALFKAATWRLLAFGTLTLGVVVLAGPQLFALVFGAGWEEAGRLAQFLAVMALARLVVDPVAQTLTVLERQDLQLAWDVLRFAALLLVFLAAHHLTWTPTLTIGVLSATMTICYLLLFMLTRRALLSRLRSSA